MILNEAYRTTARPPAYRAKTSYPRFTRLMSGQRYYSPELGRWVSRDPIEEDGGMNLLLAMANNSLCFYDYVGLKAGCIVCCVSVSADVCCAETHDDSVASEAPVTGVQQQGGSDSLPRVPGVSPSPLAGIGGISSGASDDAGRTCSELSIKNIYLRTETEKIDLLDKKKSRHGHTWLRTRAREVGHYPVTDYVSIEEAWAEFTSDATRPGHIEDDSTRMVLGKFTRQKKYRACPDTLTSIENSITAHKNDLFGPSNKNARNCVGWAFERLRDAGFSPPKSPTQRDLRPSDVP